MAVINHPHGNRSFNLHGRHNNQGRGERKREKKREKGERVLLHSLPSLPITFLRLSCRLLIILPTSHFINKQFINILGQLAKDLGHLAFDINTWLFIILEMPRIV